MKKLKFKILLLFLSFLSLTLSPLSAIAQSVNSFSGISIHPQPVIRYGNTSYHDSQGARDPWVIKDNGTYYLYYDCMESMFNPSFEPNLGTNGWDAFHSTISSLNVPWAHSGGRVLSVETDGTANANVGTGKYYFDNDKSNNAKYAAPAGIEVMPSTEYIASAYMNADPNVEMELRVVEYTNDPSIFSNATKVNGQVVYKGQKVQGRGNAGFSRVSVKFTTNSQTRSVVIALLQPNAVRSSSFWDSIQLEKTISGQNEPTAFPTSVDFNQRLEDSLGWRSCVSTSTDGVNFTKRGLVKVQGAVGDWENVNRPGWLGSSFMYANVFPYNGKWYSFYWKGGQPFREGDPDRYEKMRLQFPGGDGLDESGRFDNANVHYRDRSGLAVADSPLGPFTRISQSAPPINIANMGICAKPLRSLADATGANWGCDYLTANGVPARIGDQWVEFVAGMTARIPGIWAGTNGLGGEGGNSRYAITSGYATAPTPLGPWTLSANNPIYLESNAVLEGPIYYFDKSSNNHVLFFNQLGGHGWGVSAKWTKDIASWPAVNKKDIINKTQIPWADPRNEHTREINLPTVVEDGQNHLLVYFGVREGTRSFDTESDMRGYMFHDIGLLSINLPLFGSSSVPSSSPSVSGSVSPSTAPSASAAGPATLVGYAVAESPADLPSDVSSSRIIRSADSRINLLHNFPASVGASNYTVFARFYYSNGRTADAQQTIVYKPAEIVTPTPTATPVPVASPTATPVPVASPTATPVPVASPTATPVVHSPNMSIWNGEDGVKSSISNNEDLIIHFNRNTDVNVVNLLIDSIEEGAPTQIIVPLTGGATQIIWPKDHSKHTPGSHKVAIRGYYCPNLPSQSGCTPSGIAERTLTIVAPVAAATCPDGKVISTDTAACNPQKQVCSRNTHNNADCTTYQGGFYGCQNVVGQCGYVAPVATATPVAAATCNTGIVVSTDTAACNNQNQVCSRNTHNNANCTTYQGGFYGCQNVDGQCGYTAPTATPVPVATFVGYGVAQNPDQLPANSSAEGVIHATGGRIIRTYEFPESATKITYTLFVRFFYSNGTSKDTQQSIVYNPPARCNDGEIISTDTAACNTQNQVCSRNTHNNANCTTYQGGFYGCRNVDGQCGYTAPVVRSPSVSIQQGETGIKSTIADSEDLVINFNRNADVNVVSLRIDDNENEQRPDGTFSQVLVPLQAGGTQLTWFANQTSHTPGSHKVAIRGYYCPNLPSQAGCTASVIDTRTVTVTAPVVVNDNGTIQTSGSWSGSNVREIGTYGREDSSLSSNKTFRFNYDGDANITAHEISPTGWVAGNIAKNTDIRIRSGNYLQLSVAGGNTSWTSLRLVEIR